MENWNILFDWKAIFSNKVTFWESLFISVHEICHIKGIIELVIHLTRKIFNKIFLIIYVDISILFSIFIYIRGKGQLFFLMLKFKLLTMHVCKNHLFLFQDFLVLKIMNYLHYFISSADFCWLWFFNKDVYYLNASLFGIRALVLLLFTLFYFNGKY